MKKKQPTLEPIFLTPEKISDIQIELTEIEEQILPEIRKRMSSAYEDGDIPENNPYLTANDDLQNAMRRRNELRYLLARSKAYPKESARKNRISLGSNLTISINGGTPQGITLVSSEEASPLEGKLSIDSPIGKGIAVAKTRVFEIETPSGKIVIEIL